MTSYHAIQRTFSALAISCAYLALTAQAWAVGTGVHGRVLGHDEAGEFIGVVQGASISFEDLTGSKVGATVADSNGYYKVDLPAGAYVYKIKAAGFRSEENGRGLQLAQSQGYAIFNLSLTKGKDDPNRAKPVIPKKQMGTLKGKVLERTESGLVGVPDATISLRYQDSKVVRTAISQAAVDDSHSAGGYKTSLEIGKYYAGVVASGFESFTDLQPIEIKSGAETDHDFLLTRRKPPVNNEQGISGVVTIVDSGKTPPPIHVQIESLSSAIALIVDVPLAINGTFNQPLPIGSYRVIATAEGYPTASSPPTYVLDGRFTSVSLSLRARRTPEPKTVVEVDVFTQPQGRSERKPLAGARVSLLRSGTSDQSAIELSTDSSGHAVFPVSEAGQYTATAHLKGFRSGTGEGSVQIGERHEVEIELVKEEVSIAKEVDVTVEVKDESTKRPLAGVKIMARHPEEALAKAFRGSTNADGKVSITLEHSGKLQILAQLAGYTPGGIIAEVSDGITNLVSINLQAIQPDRPPNIIPEPRLPDDNKPPHGPEVTKPYPVNGYVAYRETSGQLRSVPDVKLIWERTTPANPPISLLTSTGTDGRFKVNLHTGNYQVQISPPVGFEPTTEQVNIDPSVHEKYFIIQRIDRKPPSGIERQLVKGAVVSEMAGRSIGIAGAEVFFIRTQNVEKALSGRAGDFSIQLPTDSYRVQVRANGYETLETKTVVGPSASPLRFVLTRLDSQTIVFSLNLTVMEQGNALVAGTRTVANAKVHVERDGNEVAMGVTDRTGHFSVRLKPGLYRLRVDKPGYDSAVSNIVVLQSDLSERMVLKAHPDSPPESFGKSILNVRVLKRSLQPSRTIQPSGIPLNGAQITITTGAKRVTTGVSNQSGVFSAPLMPGSYSIRVESQGHVPSTKLVNLTNRDTQIEFLLDPVVATQPGTPADIRTGPPLSFDLPSSGRKLLGGTSKTDVNYVVEYRLTPQSAWIVLTTKQTQREANLAISVAIERRQIPGNAETRIRTEKKLQFVPQRR